MLRQYEVSSIPTWRNWAQQELGVGWIRRAGRTNASEFVELHGLNALIRLTQFCKDKGYGKKMRTLDSVPLFYEQAQDAGWFNEEEREDADLEVKINTALYSEDDPDWIQRLVSARGEARRLVYEGWERERGV